MKRDLKISNSRFLLCAGTIMAFFAAVTAALAFFAIGFIPKTEPSLVVAIWFHAASLASSVLPLAVSLFPDLPP